MSFGERIIQTEPLDNKTRRLLKRDGYYKEGDEIFAWRHELVDFLKKNGDKFQGCEIMPDGFNGRKFYVAVLLNKEKR